MYQVARVSDLSKFERAVILALYCVMFMCVLSLSHMESQQRGGT